MLARNRLVTVSPNRELAESHAVLLLVAIAQLEPPKQAEFREFDWMRRLRNETEYPDADRPIAGLDDVDDALPTVRTMIERATAVIAIMTPY